MVLGLSKQKKNEGFPPFHSWLEIAVVLVSTFLTCRHRGNATPTVPWPPRCLLAEKQELADKAGGVEVQKGQSLMNVDP